MASFLTTLDNPFNPSTHFDEWYNYDIQKGYNSCGKLARLAPSSMDSLPESYTDSLKEDAIDSLIELMPDTYTKISVDCSDDDFKKIYEQNLKRRKSFEELKAY